MRFADRGLLNSLYRKDRGSRAERATWQSGSKGKEREIARSFEESILTGLVEYLDELK